MSLAGHSTFQRLWAAQAVSAFGARITREGLPIMAMMTLGAGAATLGVLAAVGATPNAADRRPVAAARSARKYPDRLTNGHALPI